MKYIVIMLLLRGVVLQGGSDTVQTIPRFDLSKGLNIPGIVPSNLNNNKEIKLSADNATHLIINGDSLLNE